MRRCEDERRALESLADTAAASVFFGAEHMVFGTDYPYYDPECGNQCVGKTMDAVNRVNISDADKQEIFEDNVKWILHLDNF